MLDKMMTRVLAKLDATAAAVANERSSIERERAGDDARDHAGRMLQSPEGFSTPPRKAAENAQKEYARLRREWEKDGGAAVALFLSMMVARERRDEADRWLAEYEATDAARLSTGVHPDIRTFFKLMFGHGVEPRQLANVRIETLAIVCDIVRWDGHDPDRIDPANPMHDVFAIYAERQILEHDQLGKPVVRSKPGAPVAPERDSDPRFYMFNRLTGDRYAKVAGDGNGQREAPVLAADGVHGEREAGSKGPAAEAALAVDASPTPSFSVNNSTGMKAVGPAPAPALVDEYALPPDVSAEDQATLLRAAGQFVDSDDDWRFDLKAAMGWTDSSDPEVIALVQRAHQPPGATPFRFFVEVAQRDGVEAGREAYRAATIRRVALEIASKPEWKDARTRLGLCW